MSFKAAGSAGKVLSLCFILVMCVGCAVSISTLQSRYAEISKAGYRAGFDTAIQVGGVGGSKALDQMMVSVSRVYLQKDKASQAGYEVRSYESEWMRAFLEGMRDGRGRYTGSGAVDGVNGADRD